MKKLNLYFNSKSDLHLTDVSFARTILNFATTVSIDELEMA